MKMRVLIAAIGVLVGCAACGFKGPLYLPQHNTAVVTHPAAPSAAKPAASTHKSDQKKPAGTTPAPP